VLSGAPPAQAQGYPSRPITMIEPFPPGGPTDAVARIVAEGMRAALSQPVIIENISGAGGTIGVARLARAAPDGYTIGIGQPVSHVFSGAVYNVRYDLLNDFEPIALLSSSPLWMLGSASLPANDIRELIAWLKANLRWLCTSRPSLRCWKGQESVDAPIGPATWPSPAGDRRRSWCGVAQ
jgi:tripartite-type tricarboxylate transporter receptor subunit TctC